MTPTHVLVHSRGVDSGPAILGTVIVPELDRYRQQVPARRPVGTTQAASAVHCRYAICNEALVATDPVGRAKPVHQRVVSIFMRLPYVTPTNDSPTPNTHIIDPAQMYEVQVSLFVEQQATGVLLATPFAVVAVLGVDPGRVAAERLPIVDQKQPRLGAGPAQQGLQGVAVVQQTCGTQGRVEFSNQGRHSNEAAVTRKDCAAAKVAEQNMAQFKKQIKQPCRLRLSAQRCVGLMALYIIKVCTYRMQRRVWRRHCKTGGMVDSHPQQQEVNVVPHTIDVRASDGADWQRARSGDHHRVLPRDPLTPVLLVCLPRSVALWRIVAVASQRRVVLPYLHEGSLPLQDRVHCVHRVQVSGRATCSASEGARPRGECMTASPAEHVDCRFQVRSGHGVHTPSGLSSSISS